MDGTNEFQCLILTFILSGLIMKHSEVTCYDKIESTLPALQSTLRVLSNFGSDRVLIEFTHQM